MPLLTRKKQFAIKVEASEGTAEVLAAADVVMEVEELEQVPQLEMVERNPLRADLSPTAAVVGIQAGEITGRTELKPGLLATDDPNAHRVMLALGMQQHTAKRVDLTAAPTGTFIPGEYITGGGSGTGFFSNVLTGPDRMEFVELVAFVASEVITGSISGATATVNATPAEVTIGKGYRPDSVGPSSFTAAVMQDGLKKEIFGSRGDGSIEIAGTGQVAFLAYTLNGAMVTPVDTALFTGVSIPNVVPETFKGGALQAGTDALCVDSFTLNLANTVARRVCSDAATGIKSYKITERGPTVSIDPEQELEATIAFMGKLFGGTEFGFLAQIGSTALKRVRIMASRAQYTELGNADRESLATYAATLRLNRGKAPSGDDEYIIVFY